MKYLALALALLATGALAEAPWVKLSHESGRARYYDPSFVRVDGDTREVWLLDNLDEWNGEYRSAKSMRQVNCRERTTTFAYVVFYEGSMGRGEITARVVPLPDWRPIVPGSNFHKLYRLVCTPRG